MAVLLPFPELAPACPRTCGPGGAQRWLVWGSAGAGLCHSWVHPREMWMGAGRSLWVGHFAECATAHCQQLIDGQVSQNLVWKFSKGHSNRRSERLNLWSDTGLESSTSCCHRLCHIGFPGLEPCPAQSLPPHPTAGKNPSLRGW